MGPIYTAANFPSQPSIYSAPPPSPPPQGVDEMETDSDSGTNDSNQGGDELIYCSRRAILEICASLDLQAIPLELRDLISGQKKLEAISVEVLRELVDNPIC